jgi:hypothetical protein
MLARVQLGPVPPKRLSGGVRRLLVSLLLAGFCVGDYSGPSLRPVLRGPGVVRMTPVPLDSANPARRLVGPLRLIGAWRLSSPNRAFGSWSALAVDGPWLTFVSDAGGIFRLKMDGQRPVAAMWGDLPAGPGPGGGAEKEMRDSEGMAIDPATGRAWVTFEHYNSIWRYAPGFARAERAAFPPAMQGWSANSGAEAIIRRRDGSFLVFEEGRRAPGPRMGLIWSGDPTARETPPPARFAYTPAPWFRVTDGAELPDGRLLLLERKLGLPSIVRLVLVEAAAIRPEARVAGRLLATFAPPLLADNFEALAIGREDGRTILWIASDDNFSILQRSLLMKFALDEQQKPAG